MRSRLPTADGSGSRSGGLAGNAWTWLRRVGLLAVTVLLVEYAVLPRVLDARGDLHLFLDAAPALLVLALVLESASLLAYTRLTLLVLPRGIRPRFADQLRIDLTGLGVSHVVPGGGATAAALRYRLMTEHGVPARDAASTAAAESAIAAVGLAGTFLGGLVLLGPRAASQPGYAAGGLVAACVLAVVVVGIHRLRLAGGLSRARSTRARTQGSDRDGPRSTSTFRRLGTRLTGTIQATSWRIAALMRDPRASVAVFSCAVCNWLFDAASLWVCLRCYGLDLGPGALLSAYGAANLLALLPLTPGGLGIVEGVLVPALTTLGGAAVGAVTLGVLTWRLLEFWIPIPLAGLTYVSLRLRPSTRAGSE